MRAFTQPSHFTTRSDFAVKSFEVQIDSLVGPTHIYGGLAFGNIASLKNKLKRSNPQAAALQGLEKMKLVHDLGVPQVILPPHPRPHMAALRNLGFYGSEQKILEEVYKKSPELLLSTSSQSAMWTANCATVSPSVDTSDGKVHITPANLSSYLHRALETSFSALVLKRIFFDSRYFVHHPALFSCSDLYDEGAANHTRFVVGKKSLHFFVYGRGKSARRMPSKYPARQTREAQEAIARRHLLDPGKVVYAQQKPEVIDQGVFHNDVIAVGHEDLLLVHEEAYVNQAHVLHELRSHLPLDIVTIRSADLSVKDAVKSYIFNSQILTTPRGERVIICPSEVLKVKAAKRVVESLPFDRKLFISLNQSMRNGGGPACLRLRLPLNQKELDSALASVFFTDALYEKLKRIILDTYPESLCLEDLLSPAFRRRVRLAENKISQTLGLQNLYEDISIRSAVI